MNHNIERLFQINILLDELILIDFKLNTRTFSQIINLILQMKLNTSFWISEYYFTSIIE